MIRRVCSFAALTLTNGSGTKKKKRRVPFPCGCVDPPVFCFVMSSCSAPLLRDSLFGSAQGRFGAGHLLLHRKVWFWTFCPLRSCLVPNDPQASTTTKPQTQPGAASSFTQLFGITGTAHIQTTNQISKIIEYSIPPQPPGPPSSATLSHSPNPEWCRSEWQMKQQSRTPRPSCCCERDELCGCG